MSTDPTQSPVTTSSTPTVNLYSGGSGSGAGGGGGGNGGGSSAGGSSNGDFVRKWILPIMRRDPTHIAPQIPWDERIQVGDMVRFTSEDGTPRVNFVGVNPFQPDPGFVISDSDLHEVKIQLTAENPAHAYCWVQLKTGQYIGYEENEEQQVGYTVPPPKGGG